MDKQAILKELNDALSKTGANEGDIQSVLEAHPELIPLPHLLNHRHHFNLMLKKFCLPNGQSTDFAYLTKSTVEWWVVLVEIEGSNKKIFTTRGNNNPVFSAEFNNAYDQITTWKAYVEDNKDAVKKSLMPLLIHMHENTIKFKYVLIIGRNSEISTQQQKNLFNQKNTGEIRVMTYDSLINSYDLDGLTPKIIATNTVNGLRIDNWNGCESAIFGYLKRGELFFDETIKNELIAQGYNIEAWENGELLQLNLKQPASIPSKFIGS